MQTIIEIIQIDYPFIVLKFENNVVKKIDLTRVVNKYPQLTTSHVFNSVKLDDYPTLSWSNLMTMKDENSKEFSAPLDLCPDMLFEMN